MFEAFGRAGSVKSLNTRMQQTLVGQEDIEIRLESSFLDDKWRL